MLRPGSTVRLYGVIYTIIIVEPTAPDGKVYYGTDMYGSGIWFSDNDIKKLL